MQKINKRLNDIQNNMEEGWTKFKKRRSQLKDFDLLSKKEKRLERVDEIEAAAKEAIELSEAIFKLIQEKQDDAEVNEEDRAVIAEHLEIHKLKDEKIAAHNKKI